VKSRRRTKIGVIGLAALIKLKFEFNRINKIKQKRKKEIRRFKRRYANQEVLMKNK